MKTVLCCDAGENYGIARGLLTEGKEYEVLKEEGCYYTVRCDNGSLHTKMKARFKEVEKDDEA